MVPAIIAAAVAAKMAGEYMGGQSAKDAINRGEKAYGQKQQMGIDTLNTGKSDNNAAYSPYTQVGSQGAAGFGSAVQNYLSNVGTGPQASQYQTTAGGTQAYLDPSAAYSTDQANKATQASALAKGGMGGGLAKALSNNANKMAMTNWNNAFNQQAQANQQNFVQANQQWQNNFNAQNQNVANYSNLANLGLNATTSNQGNQLAYNQGIGTMYGNWASQLQQNANNKAGVGNAQSVGLGNSLGSGILSMYGASK